MDWIDIEFRVTGTDALILRPWFGRHHPINVVWNPHLLTHPPRQVKHPTRRASA